MTVITSGFFKGKTIHYNELTEKVAIFNSYIHYGKIQNIPYCIFIEKESRRRYMFIMYTYEAPFPIKFPFKSEKELTSSLEKIRYCHIHRNVEFEKCMTEIPNNNKCEVCAKSLVYNIYLTKCNHHVHTYCLQDSCVKCNRKINPYFYIAVSRGREIKIESEGKHGIRDDISDISDISDGLDISDGSDGSHDSDDLDDSHDSDMSDTSIESQNILRSFLH